MQVTQVNPYRSQTRQSPKVQFQGLILFDMFKKTGIKTGIMGLKDRVFALLLGIQEGQGGNALMNFIQDTSILFVPKAIVSWVMSKSPIDLFEIAFVEFAESGAFYFMAPLLAQYALSNMFHNIAPKHARPSKSLLTASVTKITDEAALRKALPVKLATILSGVFISAIALNYALNFIKNWITEKQFKINEYSDVLNLTKNRLKTNEDSKVVKKSKTQNSAMCGNLCRHCVGKLCHCKNGT